MYQIHADIFRKIELYVSIARKLKEDIKEINVRNEIERHFGKSYCRVYFDIELKEGSERSYELYQIIQHVFYRYGDKEYISFYLQHDDECTDKEYLLRNIKEQAHYDYIWNLLEWNLEKDGIKVNNARFKSQLHLRRIRLEEDKKWEQERRIIEDAVETVSPEVGHLIVIRQWRGSPLRVGKAEKVVLPNKRQSFSLELSELKKDLVPGKTKINLYSKTEIYAVIVPQELPNGIGKAELLDSLERGDDISGLIWRRPNEVWK